MTRPGRLRGRLVGGLLAGVLVAVTGVLAGTIASAARETAGRHAINGVLMPADASFRRVVRRLLARRHAERLRGITVVGSAGKVTVLRARRGSPGLLSAYLNPEVLSLIARAVGAGSAAPTVVAELRLEVVGSTGRQRWRLRGTRAGALWRATIQPNGTHLRTLTARAAS